MRPALLALIIMGIFLTGIILVVLGEIASENKTRHPRPPQIKHNKAWHRKRQAEENTVHQSEDAYFQDTHWLTPRSRLIYGDELHLWIILRTTDNAYGVEHAWKDCPKCAPLGGPENVQAKTQENATEKTPENVPEKTPDNGGEKTSGENPGKTSGVFPENRQPENAAVRSWENADPIWMETSSINARETSGGKPRPTFTRKRWMYPPEAFTSTFVYAETPQPVDEPVDTNTDGLAQGTIRRCRDGEAHGPHRWFPAGADSVAWCGGVIPAKTGTGMPEQWCLDVTAHREHLWSDSSRGDRNTKCSGTWQAWTERHYEMLLRTITAGRVLPPPETKPVKPESQMRCQCEDCVNDATYAELFQPGQNDISGVEWMADQEFRNTPVSSYRRCPQPSQHAPHRWATDTSVLCSGDGDHPPADAADAGYGYIARCPLSYRWETHDPHPHHGKTSGIKQWCPGWKGPKPHAQ